jgi:site-specific recombinase XerD
MFLANDKLTLSMVRMTDPTTPTLTTQAVELGPLMDKARGYVAASKALNTVRAYRSDWQHFTAWCSARGLPILPAAPETIALYIADLGGVAKPSTITRRLAAIAKAHQAAGHDSPCAMRHAAVKEVLSGVRRTHGTAQAGKAALLTEHLRRLLAVIPGSLLGERDTAILLLGFAGAFRRSELVALDVPDVESSDDGMKVTIRRSKTDQEGLGRVVGIPYGSDPQLCPVRSLRRWLEAAGITEGPLFRSVSRHGHIADSALTAQSVRDVVQRYCQRAELDLTKFSAHSLRSGFVTQATINSASERSIMNQTGHKSPTMVRRYTRDLNLFRENAATRLGL